MSNETATASTLPQLSQENSFAAAVALINRRGKLVVLAEDRGDALVAVWPGMQGRVMTSSAEGMQGPGFGWVNRELIASGEAMAHMNAVGGEDRLWLGPEGGQFSIFFAPGVPFEFEHWFTPAPIDTEAFEVVDETKTSVAMRKDFALVNYSGTKFDLRIDREIRLLSSKKIWSYLGVTAAAGVKTVGFESDNKLTNRAAKSWSKEGGLLSLWVLSQFQSSPESTVILPIHAGSEADLGIAVTKDYFGEVPADRIAIRDEVVLFKADSNCRSKVGLSQRRAKGILGSYDALNHVLTIVQYNQPTESAEYVNSAWKIQDEPYKGDVANSYNDGPATPGGPQLGHFYELESSSPARVLGAGESVSHTQRTMHLVGDEQQLDAICRATLGIGLADARL